MIRILKDAKSTLNLYNKKLIAITIINLYIDAKKKLANQAEVRIRLLNPIVSAEVKPDLSVHHPCSSS